MIFCPKNGSNEPFVDHFSLSLTATGDVSSKQKAHLKLKPENVHLPFYYSLNTFIKKQIKIQNQITDINQKVQLDKLSCFQTDRSE